ncbi:MAG: dual specificity protein phosphatase family protein [Planctomycetota bacterium]
MRVGLGLGAAASGLAAVAFLGPGLVLRVAAGWLAVSLLGLGLGYAGLGPGVWLKRGGKLHPAGCAVFAPLHLLNRLLAWVLPRVRRESAFDEVAPGLFLGRRLTGREAREHRFHAVLDTTAEFGECAALRRGPYLCIPLLDGTAPTEARLREGIDFIRRELHHGSVYVHCALGHGRSALFVAAYLVASGRVLDAGQAVDFVRERRPRVRLGAPQRRVLETVRP